MTPKKVLMVSGNYWLSPFQVGSHQLARGFVKAGWDVAFVSDPISPFHLLSRNNMEILKERFSLYKDNGHYDLNGHLWAYVPGALLTPHNKRLLRSGFVHKYWSYWTIPNLAALVKSKGFGEIDLVCFDNANQSFWLKEIKYNKSIYRIADNNSSFSKFTPALGKIENEFTARVDIVAYTAKNLRAKIESMNPKETLYLPNGVNYEHFAMGNKNMPLEYTNIPKPIAIYVGAMDFWFDYELINHTVEKLPDISFVLIGPDELAKARLKKSPNLYLLGRKNYNLLPAYLYNANIGIIPFDVKTYPELVNSINPLKLYEYLACGLPVVSVEWKELKELNVPVNMSQDADGFVTNIKKAAFNTYDRQQLMTFAQQEDWSIRVESIIKSALKS